jgi:hypothetical protein
MERAREGEPAWRASHMHTAHALHSSTCRSCLCDRRSRSPLTPAHTLPQHTSQRVCELGAGTGALSAACALAGATCVLATDQACHVAQLAATAAANGCGGGGGDASAKGTMVAAELAWGGDAVAAAQRAAQALGGPPDLILLSEVSALHHTLYAYPLYMYCIHT